MGSQHLCRQCWTPRNDVTHAGPAILISTEQSRCKVDHFVVLFFPLSGPLSFRFSPAAMPESTVCIRADCVAVATWQSERYSIRDGLKRKLFRSAPPHAGAVIWFLSFFFQCQNRFWFYASQLFTAVLLALMFPLQGVCYIAQLCKQKLKNSVFHATRRG